VRAGHVVALIGALLLLLVTSMDWYGTQKGEEFREAQRNAEDSPALSEVEERAEQAAEPEEKNAWQAADLSDWDRETLIDKVLLAVILAAALLAALTAMARTAGAQSTPGLGPAGVAALLATLGAALVAYRIIQEPGLDAATVVKPGAPLALLPLALIALGASSALRADAREEETPTEEEEPDAGAA